jgi:hypothetical protein
VTAIEALIDELASKIGLRVAELVAAQLPPIVVAEPWGLLDSAGVAKMLGRSERWVRDRARDGSLPWVRLDGGAKAFDPDDVRAFARARRIPAPSSDRLQVVR